MAALQCGELSWSFKLQIVFFGHMYMDTKGIALPLAAHVWVGTFIEHIPHAMTDLEVAS